MDKILIFGLDLSFNSTGITTVLLNDNQPISIAFDRVVYDKQPRKIENIDTISYVLPTNITTDELVIECDKNNREQIETTLRSMMCSKAIKTVLKKHIENNSDATNIIFCIENYVMPSFGGPNSLKNVSGLIALQSFIREYIIKLKLNGYSVRFMTPTPTQNKKFFTGSGKAQKHDMMRVFVEVYDGLKLIPDVSKGKLDDVIDSFALACQALYEYRNTIK